jgi:membrane protein
MQVVWSLIKETYTQWSDDKAARLGAALSYYAVFSIGPLLVVVTAIAGLVFGPDAVQSEVTTTLKGLLGDAGAAGVSSMLAQASEPRQGSFALVLGGVTLVLGALGVVVQLKDALNAIWNVDTRTATGVWAFLRTYVVSAAAVLALAFLLLVSLTVSAAVSALGGVLLSGIGEALMYAFDLSVNFALMTILFAMMFKWLPDVRVSWHDVVIGALVTSMLFTIGKFAIGVYLGNAQAESAFGASASLVIVLVWVYYTAQIVFMGAEFTQVYARRFGSHAGEVHTSAATESRAQDVPLRAVKFSNGTVVASALALALAWYEHRRRRAS